MIKRPRKTSNQANRERFETKAIEKHLNSKYKEALKLASKELSININGPNKGKRGFGARAVAKKYNAVYLNEEGDKQITRTTLSNYADEELAGQSPLNMLKKGGFDEAISAHSKNRSTLWERLLKFGADNDGKRNWVGQMQHLKETFWETAPVEKLLKLPPLFTVDTSMEGGALEGGKDDNEQAAM
jgi:hypothetical protein